MDRAGPALVNFSSSSSEEEGKKTREREGEAWRWETPIHRRPVASMHRRQRQTLQVFFFFSCVGVPYRCNGATLSSGALISPLINNRRKSPPTFWVSAVSIAAPLIFSPLVLLPCNHVSGGLACLLLCCGFFFFSDVAFAQCILGGFCRRGRTAVQRRASNLFSPVEWKNM